VLKVLLEDRELKDRVEDLAHKVLKGTKVIQEGQVGEVLLDPHPTQE
jgi:hypothetical protein